MQKFYLAATMSLLISACAFAMNKHALDILNKMKHCDTASAIDTYENDDLGLNTKRKDFKSKKNKIENQKKLFNTWENYLEILLNIKQHKDKKECHLFSFRSSDGAWCGCGQQGDSFCDLCDCLFIGLKEHLKNMRDNYGYKIRFQRIDKIDINLSINKCKTIIRELSLEH